MKSSLHSSSWPRDWEGFSGRGHGLYARHGRLLGVEDIHLGMKFNCWHFMHHAQEYNLTPDILVEGIKAVH